MGVKIQLQIKSVTGRVRYYPIGENARHVLQLTKKKTLSELDVEALKALGCDIEKKIDDQPTKKKGSAVRKQEFPAYLRTAVRRITE